jgi:NAD-dependent deacetylase
MLANLIKKANYTVVFTGAGMSTESGVPDFRSQQGIWRHKDPAKLASTYALMHNREEFVEFYRGRIETLTRYQPHAGHDILAKWEKKGLIQSVITQNVDRFHQQAGSQSVTELHGTIRQLRCLDCNKHYPGETYLQENGTSCTCGGFLRPCVVLFGESLPEEALDTAEREALQADLFIVLGSSLQVSPANFFPQLAKRNGAKLVIINMEPTPLDSMADLVIHERKIGDVLKEANEKIENCTNE